jgi:hypothetical protein
MAQPQLTNRQPSVMSILKLHGIRGLTKRGDTPRYVENEPEAYTTEEPDTLFAACKPEYRVLFTIGSIQIKSRILLRIGILGASSGTPLNAQRRSSTA